ncbi:MAG: Asp-tRNA(Asn)/Glu-tRNA(Gln) amidotransferase subunit GatA [Acidobacteria bacterium]|nr:Asp-tRNA(Asn)/Glu-tRNA(Gln) amidotransferase subunit GatA [Acidobacteriota bacterium]MCU0253220.1 Asp-tRNA(Asn)/Glu-tRNA(Gln) amidotransferase subunit GatA [Acidobacteriota bacterium]
MSVAPPTARALAAAVRSGELTAEASVGRALTGIARRQDLGAFLQVDPEGALAVACAQDRALAAGRDPGPLAGVPLAVKDNLCARGFATTCGSRILAGWTPPYDATAVARLVAAGAIVVGKTNCDEFGMGSSNENSAFGPVAHPEDPDRVPGGSSGGSAAAVAAGLVPLALGSDTGGSVRQPASFCGIVGLKPTWGRVSRWGLVAFASSLDQVGPLTRDVRDAALALALMAGPDERDATAAPVPVPDELTRLEADPSGLRIGVLRGLSESDGTERAVRDAVRSAADALAAGGASVEDAELPLAAYGLPIYALIATAEASSNLARYDGVRFGRRAEGAGSPREMMAATRGAGFGPEVKRRIMLGTFALSAGYHDAYYGRAQRARARLAAELDALFERFDALLLPTSPGIAFRRGERVDDPLAMYLADVFTVAASLGGHPAISIPAPRAEGTLPVGVQLIAPRFGEPRLLRAALALEERGFAAGGAS